MRLILASQSPRRSQLLQQAGYDFEVVTPSDSAECGICSRETPPELVMRLARQKAQDVADRGLNGMILAADTVASCRGHILGKPADRQHAREMLQLLRGAEHQVYTGVCLWRSPGDRKLVDVDVTTLWMESISDEQLEAYLDTHAWEGKAGGFGFQDGPDWLRLLNGSASNVVGLPMELLQTMLTEMQDPGRAP